MLSQYEKEKLESVKETLKRSESRVLSELEELGVSYQQFQLLKSNENKLVSLH